LTQLTIYKLKSWGKFVVLCLFLSGLGHFLWTILCFMANIDRGY